MNLIPMDGYKDFSCGIVKDEVSKEYHLENCVRLFPHKIHGEGHFASLMKKGGMKTTVAANTSKKKDKITEEWLSFETEVLKTPLFDGEYSQVGESLYLNPCPQLIQKKIRYLRTGLYLGDTKKKRFEPSQALAMYLRPEKVKQVLSLASGDIRVIKYLKGESLELSDEETLKNGWVLVCVDGYSLGWGKIVNGTLRNKYYSGWRMN